MSPDSEDNSQDNKDTAADLVRQKIDTIYKEGEPDAVAEEKEVANAKHLSKHQKFMQDLIDSGRSTEQIQETWHQYYLKLDDKEKKEVWDEFYSNNKATSAVSRADNSGRELVGLKNQAVTPKKFETPEHNTGSRRHVAKKIEEKIKKEERKEQPASKVRLKPKHYFQSLLFGLSMGLIVIFIFLFGFFNEIIIAPLIQPSRSAVATPVIIGDGNLTDTNVQQVVIPKINVQIPVDYAVSSTNENVIENDLQGGIIHYPQTAVPGQLGNAAFFGHSSNNIFNAGKYKFAFVLLHTLVKGDTFYLTYNHTIYIYQVISTHVVSPSDIGVLGPVADQPATATLITCDPPGTSINRLIVVGTQISPSISGDVAASAANNAGTASHALPNDGPSLWSRFSHSDAGKATFLVLGAIVVAVIFRRTNKRD
jgi:LPXTG-site transpeptidase (sortase) family protein